LAELRSKVTLRPRSKLERVLDALEKEHAVPHRPRLGIVGELVRGYLEGFLVPEESSARTRRPSTSKPAPVELSTPEVTAIAKAAATSDGASLATLVEADLAGIADATAAAARLEELRAVHKAARTGLSATAKIDLDETRRRLMAMPAMDQERCDSVLLAAGAEPVVAPSPNAQRVAARLGYPGATYAALARALDAEIPDRDVTDVAWRAHYVLALHGQKVCTAKSPECGACRVRDACSFRGEGEDPALRLA
jgi:endonuclease III